MTTNVDFITDDHCGLIIKDLTLFEDDNFQGVSDSGYRKLDCIFIDVLIYNKTRGSVVKDVIYSSSDNEIKIKLLEDGYVTVHHIVLPTKDYIEEQTKLGILLYSPEYDRYCTDGKLVYLFVAGGFSPVDILTIVERNTKHTNISRTSLDYVSICHLKKCYISMCLQILNNLQAFDTCSKTTYKDLELLFKRDVALMAINVIKWMVKHDKLEEAQRILEKINGCNGLCQEESISKYEGCRCSGN